MLHDDAVIYAEFFADGKRIVTISADKTARVWDAATGAPIGKPLRGEAEAWSLDGTRIVTASGDNTAQVWDAATATPIGQPFQLGAHVNSAASSPDGHEVVTVSEDKMARVWIAPPVAPDIVAAGCEMLGRNQGIADLSTRYGVDVKDPICTPGEPAPDPARMIDRLPHAKAAGREPGLN